MSYLKSVILASLAISGVCSTADSFAQTPTLPTVTVIAPNIPSNTIYLGGNLGGGSWVWDNSPSWDNITPDAYDPYVNAPEQCSLLAITGRPTDCTQFVADTFSAVTYFNQPVSYSMPPEWVSISTASAYWYAYSYSISQCYANPANDPDTCEANHVQDAYAFCGYGYWAPGQLALCNAGAANIGNRVSNAANDRFVASWLGFSPGAYGVDINFPVGAWILNTNQYNVGYFQMRKGIACAAWFDVWNNNDCATYYGNI